MRGLAAANVALLCAIVALATEVALYSRNTLGRHPWLELSKAELSLMAMGEKQTFTTRNLLAGNQLNLHAWHGFQGVLVKCREAPAEISFRYRLQEGAHLVVLVNETREGYWGVRLSRERELPGLLFQADRKGRFLSSRRVPELDVEDESWHQVVIMNRPESAEITTDGAVAAILPRPIVKGTRLGFRGSRAETVVDDLCLRDAQRKVILQDGFANRGSFGKVAGVGLLLGGALLLLVLAIARPAGKRGLLRILLLEIELLLLLALYLAFDYGYWSHRYPYAGVIPAGIKQPATHPFEEARQKLARLLDPLDPSPDRTRTFTESFQALHAHRGASSQDLKDSAVALESYRALGPKPRWTVLLLGSSQTRGSGALDPEDRICCQIQRRLTDAGLDVCLVNAARNGTNSTELLERYRRHLLALEPNLVVVNLGTNDADRNLLRGNLEALTDINASRGIQTLLVLEPNSDRFTNVTDKHPALKDVAASRKLRLLDLYEELLDPANKNSGLLWWDFVHLTSHGQSLAAEHIAEALKGMIAEAPKP